ncbi:MAG: O-antigen ligase family protein [Chloroflexota bacterium]|nr:O-antigen ligase family protein [Chloroflexota bacterium]
MNLSNRDVRQFTANRNLLIIMVIVGVLASAWFLGQRASILWLGLLVVGIGATLVLKQPLIGLLALVVIALVGPIKINTGTTVQINPTTLVIPALLVLWVLVMILQKDVRLVPSAVNKPLIAFVIAGLISLLVGSVLWNPLVPRSGNFLLVQMAQWAIFAFSAGAFLLTANLVKDELWLQRLTFAFLVVSGGLAILSLIPVTRSLVYDISTIAFIRAPFWMLIAALAGGQLLFNGKLSAGWRIFLIVSLLAVVNYAFFLSRDSASTWGGVGTAFAVLIWFRFPRVRWLLVLFVLALAATGALFPALWDFAGGDTEWKTTGGSRIALIERVMQVSMFNPVTGLGPAAYRKYAAMEPLKYGNAFWVAPQVNSHNNFVDLFSHVGIVGLVLFAWFVWEMSKIGGKLRSCYLEGFSAGYVNGTLAAGVGALVLMMFADWILPFVYNIGFHGFQASVLVWLFLGGLVALEQMMPAPEACPPGA